MIAQMASTSKLRCIAVSDTHEQHRQLKVPPGDVFLFAGDFSMLGEEKYVKDFNDWLGALPHKHKVVIAGNHDLTFDSKERLAGGHWEILRKERQSRLTNATHYLLQSGCEIKERKFWGSPYTPRFFDWAFMYDRAAGKEQWAGIPEGLDVLITHGPPDHVLDTTVHGDSTGCWDLMEKIREVKPRFHVFGHIHEAYGHRELDGTHFYNVAAVDRLYRMRPSPCVEFDI